MSKNKIPEFLRHAKQLKKNAIRYAAAESVIFFKESFVNEGWTDGALTKWKKSSTPLAGKRTLYKSGKLMQSIRKLEATDQRLVVIADSDHAEIHNEGGYITVTEQMKRYFWVQHLKFKKRNKKKAEFCKFMALKKVGSKVKIDKRQFIGESRTLMQNLDSWFRGSVNSNFDKTKQEYPFLLTSDGKSAY